MNTKGDIIQIEILHSIDQYLYSIDLKMPDLISGFYLIGSLGLDDFISGISDIDFVALYDRRLSPKDLTSLSIIHSKLKNMRFRHLFDGVYINRNDLLHDPDKKSAPYYFNGEFHIDNGFAANPITWYMLKHHKFIIRGNPQIEVNITINEVKNWCRENLKSYWTNWIAASQDRMINKTQILSPEETAWGVLGIVRLYATIESGKIISKSRAGFYALDHFDDKWHFIINDALSTRIKNRKKYCMDPFTRGKTALDFMNHVMEKASEL